MENLGAREISRDGFSPRNIGPFMWKSMEIYIRFHSTLPASSECNWKRTDYSLII
jgi:hypothetical protein